MNGGGINILERQTAAAAGNTMLISHQLQGGVALLEGFQQSRPGFQFTGVFSGAFSPIFCDTMT